MPSRLGANPAPTSEVTSKVMRANRGRNTGPELKVRKALWSAGIRGYRLHWRNVPGRPDIAFPGLRLAVFVLGCYWHRCESCDLPIPKSNSEFWSRKFALNKERDKRKRTELEDMGWDVLDLWECDIKDSLDECVRLVSDMHSRLASNRGARLSQSMTLTVK